MEKVVLYGAGIEGEKWYVKNHKKYDIQYVLDRRNNRTFHGLPVFSKEEKMEEMGRYKIIVAARFGTYLNIANGLKECGLKEYRDFEWMQSLGKKLIVMYGNCHMGIIAEYFRLTPSIFNNYVIRAYSVCSEDICSRIPSDEILQKCSVFIAQDIREDNIIDAVGYKSLLKKVKKDCQVCIIPNLYGLNLFYPQIEGGGNSLKKHLLNIYQEEAIHDQVYQIAVDSFNNIAGIKDENIERIYKEGKTIDEILDFMEDKNSYNWNDIRENLKNEMEKFKKREKKCQIRISDFIEENYKEVQLFYEPYHPTNELLCEVARRILDYFGFDYKEELNVLSSLGYFEIFIYESVRCALGLKFQQEYIKVDYKWKDYTIENKPLSKREYVEDYICWNLE